MPSIVVSCWAPHFEWTLCFASWCFSPHKAVAQTSSSVQSFSRVWLFATPWTAACQASLSFTSSQRLLKLMSIKLVMPSNHLILCHPLHLLPSIFPRIKVFSNESALHIRWPKSWSFSFSISPSNDWSPCSPRDSQVFSNNPSSKASMVVGVTNLQNKKSENLSCPNPQTVDTFRTLGSIPSHSLSPMLFILMYFTITYFWTKVGFSNLTAVYPFPP